MRKMLLMACVMFVSLALVLPAGAAEKKLVVGSKAFTEQRLLGQIMILLLEKNGFKTEDRTGLGGTLVVREALVNKQIDICMEYTGTALMTVLKAQKAINDPVTCYEFVKKEDLEKNGVVWLDRVDLNNTYCLMMLRTNAEKFKIKTLSDVANYVRAHPSDVTFGTNAEFYARPDGYKPLQQLYDFRFPEDKIIKMDFGLVYKAVKEGQVLISMGTTTDGRIKEYDILVLQDDKNYFPIYNPCPVVLKEIFEKYPELGKIFNGLATKLTTEKVTELNFSVDGEHKPIKQVAEDWLKSAGLL
jgi:osmoprotectant transport system substrate-binding protein